MGSPPRWLSDFTPHPPHLPLKGPAHRTGAPSEAALPTVTSGGSAHPEPGQARRRPGLRAGAPSPALSDGEEEAEARAGRSCWGSSVLPAFAGAPVPSPAAPPEPSLGSSVDQPPEALQAAQPASPRPGGGLCGASAHSRLRRAPSPASREVGGSQRGFESSGLRAGPPPPPPEDPGPPRPALRPPPQRAPQPQGPAAPGPRRGQYPCRPGGGGEEPVSEPAQATPPTPHSQPSPPPQGSRWSSRGPPPTLLLPPGPPPSASRDPRRPSHPQGQLSTNLGLGAQPLHTHIHPVLDDLEHGDGLWIQQEARPRREIFGELDFSL